MDNLIKTTNQNSTDNIYIYDAIHQNIAVTNQGWKGVYYSNHIDITKKNYTPISITITDNTNFTGAIVPTLVLYGNDGVTPSTKHYVSFLSSASQTVYVSYRIVYLYNN